MRHPPLTGRCRARWLRERSRHPEWQPAETCAQSPGRRQEPGGCGSGEDTPVARQHSGRPTFISLVAGRLRSLPFSCTARTTETRPDEAVRDKPPGPSHPYIQESRCCAAGPDVEQAVSRASGSKGSVPLAFELEVVRRSAYVRRPGFRPAHRRDSRKDPLKRLITSAPTSIFSLIKRLSRTGHQS